MSTYSSTDKISTDTNPQVFRILKRGNLDVTAPGTTSAGTATVTFEDLSSSRVLYIEVYQLITGGGAAAVYKLPFTSLGTFNYYTWFDVRDDSGKLKLTIYYERETLSSNTFYYIVYSLEIVDEDVF